MNRSGKPAEFLAGVEDASFVVVIGYIVGPFFELGPGISHSNAEKGRDEHRNIVQSVTEHDDIFQGRPDVFHEPADTGTFIGRFHQIGVGDVRKAGKTVRIQWQIIRFRTDMDDFIDSRQGVDIHRGDDRLEQLGLAEMTE